MRLACEFPDAHLEELSVHTDFDFALAHLILQEGSGSKYVKFYRKQAANGREVWMDNSFHELGYALALEKLLEAAKLIRPTHIVAHEVAKDHVATYHHTVEMVKAVRDHRLSYKVVGCWQGSKRGLAKLETVSDVVALPFRRPRHTVLTPDNCSRYHYFGIRTLDELRRLPPRSIDTSAPIKYALAGLDMNSRERRLRAPLLDYKAKYSDELLGEIVKNIRIMKEAAGSKHEYNLTHL